MFEVLMRLFPKRCRGKIVERLQGHYNTLLLRYESGYCCLIDEKFVEHDLQAEIEFTRYRWKVFATINGQQAESPPLYKFQALDWAAQNCGPVIHTDDNLKIIFVRGTGQIAIPGG